jgi:microcystin degradation protein MlrC
VSKRPTRLFTAALAMETNTFSPIPAGFKLYRECYFVRNGEHADPGNFLAVPLVIWRDRAKARGWEVVESLATAGPPANRTLKHVYESFRDEIIGDLKKAMPVDVVLLNLHGAMVAEGYDDCEGDLIQACRAVVGPDVPIGVELDLHCHLTEAMLTGSTAMVIYKEYPHVDADARAEELFTIIADTVDGKVRPHQALFDCRTIGLYPTTTEPMASFVAKMQALEGKDGVLSLSLGHGFPWADVAEVGTKMLVITDDRPEEGAKLAEQLGREIYAMRREIEPPWLNLEPALERVFAISSGKEQDRSVDIKGGGNAPVVIADVSDNSGGGAPNDSTFVLRALIERGVTSAAIGCFWDPGAVALCEEVGVGGRLDLRLGGKIGPSSGKPLDLQVTVLGLIESLVDTMGDGRFGLGRAAAVRIDGTEIDIVLITARCQTFTPKVFTEFGIDPMAKEILQVKSMNHFRGGFAPISRGIVYAATPGAIDVDYTRLAYTKVTRPVWPLVADPWTS